MNDQISTLEALRRIVARRSPRQLHKLSELTVESKVRNEFGLDASHVMGVDRDRGIVPMREHTIGSELDRYKVLRPGAFAYNPMRLNIGSIARWPGPGNVLVSGDYVVFEAIDGKLDGRYLDHIRRSAAWKQHVAAAGSGSVRVRIYYDDLAAMRISIPPIDEQRLIADLIADFEKEISVLQRLRDCFIQGAVYGS